MKSKDIVSIIAIVAAVIIITIIVAVKFFIPSVDTNLEIDDNATVGIMPGVDMDQRRKELQDALDESMIAFSVNLNPAFATGASEGNLMLENPDNNAKLLVAEIYLNDESEALYASKAVKPGSYIENVKLSRVLEKGSYEAIIYFKAYREDTKEFIGQTGAAIEIHILN